MGLIKKPYLKTRSYTIFIIIGWTLIIFILLGVAIYGLRMQTLEIARTEARTSIEKDLVYRRWNAIHGGVYVPITEDTLPNPYLPVENREITTTNGLELTLMNPAYMTRQALAIGEKQYGFHAHLTSLNPIRPLNEADPWEKQALEAFEQGETEISSLEILHGEEHLRLMRPFYTEESCLKCHGAQGYEIGDIRGGLSVTIPMSRYAAVKRASVLSSFAGYFTLWLFGVVGIYFVSRDIQKRILEREQTLVQINESEERFSTLAEAAFEGIVISDKGRVLDCNEQLAKMLGYEQPEMIGIEVRKFVAPESLEMVLMHIKSENEGPYEHLSLRRDGMSFPVEVRAKSIPYKGQRVRVTVIRDMTKHKNAEEALRENEERFRTLVNSLNDVVYTLDQDQRHTGVYGKWVEKAGLTPDFFIGKTSREIFGPDAATVHEGANRRALDGETVTYEWSTLGSSGDLHYQTVVSPLRDVNGVITGIVGIGRNITKRKQAEDALRQRESDLRRAQAVAQLGSYSWDLKTNRIEWSDELHRLMWAENMEPSYELFLSHLHQDDKDRVSTQGQQVRETNDSSEMIYRLVGPDGTIRWMLDRIQVEHDDQGQPIRMHGTNQDITERKQAEEKIFQQLEYLRALHKIDQAITSNLDLKKTLDFFVEEVATQLHVDAVSVLLLDQEQKLNFAAGCGFLHTDTLKYTRLPVGQGLAGRAVAEHQVIHVDDLRQITENPALSMVITNEGFVAYYGVPLIAKGQVLGVLEVFHRSDLASDEDWVDFLETLAGQAAISVDNATLFDELQQSNRELSLAYDATLRGWSYALDLRDKETEGHTQRVTEVTIQLARELGVSENELIHIQRGALLHDIGKMGVPDSILLKPGPLTDDEWLIMRKHPIYAYEMLLPIQYLHPALDIPHYHHERWDGFGYPSGLKGEGIPLAARIFAVVDVWDALGSDRPYRDAWSQEAVLKYIQEQAGTHFDPQVVLIFLKLNF